MPKNRVQELEVTVEELQAKVVGLTEELVDVKRRLRELEAQAEGVPADQSSVGVTEGRRSPLDADSTDIIIC